MRLLQHSHRFDSFSSVVGMTDTVDAGESFPSPAQRALHVVAHPDEHSAHCSKFVFANVDFDQEDDNTMIWCAALQSGRSAKLEAAT